MDRDALLVIAIGAGAALLLWRQSAQAATGGGAIDTSILDANDARAADPTLSLDTSILDANDARAQGNAATVSTPGYYDNVQYDELGNVIGVGFWSTIMPWSESKIPSQYLPAIRAAESQNGLPRNLLARQLWQESQYNASAINPNSGAQGIAQFMPATAQGLGIDPFNPLQAIAAAGRYMRQLYDATGTWAKALAAYNWGIGNVQRKGIASAPAETKNYYSSILADIGMGLVTA